MKRLLILLALLFPLQSQAQNVEILSNVPPSVAIEYYGLNTNRLSFINKFGHNSEIDIANPADLWSGGSQTAATDRIYTYEGFIAGYDSLQVVSTSRYDSVSNGGARSVHIHGLDSLWNPQEVEIALEGTDTVNTSEVFRRVFRLHVHVGLGNGVPPDTSSNNGIIIVNTFTGNTRMGQMEIGKNQSQMAVYTIPAGWTGFLTSFYASLEKGTGATAFANMELYTRDFGEVFRLRNEQGLASDGNSHFAHPFPVALRLPEKTDIKLRLDTSTNNVDIVGGFTIIRVKR